MSAFPWYFVPGRAPGQEPKIWNLIHLPFLLFFFSCGRPCSRTPSPSTTASPPSWPRSTTYQQLYRFGRTTSDTSKYKNATCMLQNIFFTNNLFFTGVPRQGPPVRLPLFRRAAPPLSSPPEDRHQPPEAAQGEVRRRISSNSNFQHK